MWACERRRDGTSCRKHAGEHYCESGGLYRTRVLISQNVTSFRSLSCMPKTKKDQRITFGLTSNWRCQGDALLTEDNGLSPTIVSTLRQKQYWGGNIKAPGSLGIRQPLALREAVRFAIRNRDP